MNSHPLQDNQPTTGWARLSAPFMSRVWGRLKSSEKAVYPVLVSHLPNVEPSQQRLAHLIGLESTALNEAIKGLAAVGLIARRKRRTHDGVILNTHYDLPNTDDPAVIDAIVGKLEQREKATTAAHLRVDEDGRSISVKTSQPSPSRRSSHLRVGGDKVLQEKQNNKRQQQDTANAADADDVSFSNKENPVKEELVRHGVTDPELSRLTSDPSVTVYRIRALAPRTKGKTNPPGYLISLLKSDANIALPTTPKAFCKALKAGQFKMVNGRDLTSCKVTQNGHGVYVDGELFIPAAEIEKAQYELSTN